MMLLTDGFIVLSSPLFTFLFSNVILCYQALVVYGGHQDYSEFLRRSLHFPIAENTPQTTCRF